MIKVHFDCQLFCVAIWLICNQIHISGLIECCVEISIDFHQDEFNEHHKSPLVGIYRMIGLDVKSNYEYRHHPRLHKLHRQTDRNWKVEMLNISNLYSMLFRMYFDY